MFDPPQRLTHRLLGEVREPEHEPGRRRLPDAVPGKAGQPDALRGRRAQKCVLVDSGRQANRHEQAGGHTARRRRVNEDVGEPGEQALAPAPVAQPDPTQMPVQFSTGNEICKRRAAQSPAIHRPRAPSRTSGHR